MGSSDGEASTKHVIGNRRHIPNPKKGKETENGGAGMTAEHIEVAEKQKRPGFVKRSQIHIKRWWCCYGLGIFVFLAIFLPVFFLVAFPAIAQRMVDDAALPIHSAKIMYPSPNSVEYSLVASIKVPPPFTVHLDPITLHLYRHQSDPENPYIDVDLPAYDLKGNSTISIEGQEVEILDVDEFTEFLSAAVYQETFILATRGSTTAHLGALKADINLDRQIEQPGLNKIKGYSIESARLLFPPPEDGALMAAVLNIPNASRVTFQLGNVTLNVMIGGYDIGKARLYDVELKPGNNSVPARLDADIQAAVKNIAPILESQAEPLRRGNLELSASGKSTIYNGEHIEYFEKVLNGLTLTSEIPIMKILSDSIGGLLSDNSGMLRDIMGALNDTGLTDVLGEMKSVINKAAIH